MERLAWIKASQSCPPESIGEWKDIDRDELKVWMGITYYRGLVKLPRVQDYWSRDTFLSGFGGQLVKVTGCPAVATRLSTRCCCCRRARRNRRNARSRDG